MQKKIKKKIILRSLFGIPIGITIGYLISIAGSLMWGQGYYSPCVPELVLSLGSEIRAVVLQTALCALLGLSFSATSVLWEIENWSLVKQTGIYFMINSIVMMPVAWFTRWMEHSFIGFLRYFGMFAAIFILIWVLECIIGRRNIAKMNEKLHQSRQEEK